MVEQVQWSADEVLSLPEQILGALDQVWWSAGHVLSPSEQILGAPDQVWWSVRQVQEQARQPEDSVECFAEVVVR